jgi:murein DD-endopeptidase MepM/ murein hydrolase activator NlpD
MNITTLSQPSRFALFSLFLRRAALLSLVTAVLVAMPAFAGKAYAAEKKEAGVKKTAPASNAKKSPAPKTARQNPKPSDGKTASTRTNTTSARTKTASGKKTQGKPKKNTAKSSRKRIYVTSMLPEEVKLSLRERGIFSGFGPRASSSRSKSQRLHKGIDVSAPLGSSITAFNDGEVVFSGRDRSYGISIVILQTDGRKARYAHMQQAVAAAGDKVVRGQKIGLVGRTGRSTGPHLHFELIEDDTHVDPALHVWDSTELVLRPGDLDPGESHEDDRVAALFEISTAAGTLQ